MPEDFPTAHDLVTVARKHQSGPTTITLPNSHGRAAGWARIEVLAVAYRSPSGLVGAELAVGLTSSWLSKYPRTPS